MNNIRKHFSIFAAAWIAGVLMVSGCQATPPPVEVGTMAAVSSTPVPTQPSATPLPTATQEPTETDTPSPITSATPTPQATPKLVTPTGQLTAVPTLSDQAAKNALVAAFEKLKSAYPYRLAEDSTGANPYSRVTDYAAADRTHTVFNSGSPAAGLTEMIRDGGQQYYLENGSWTTNTPPGATGSLLDLTSVLVSGLKSVTYGGQETVQNVACFVFITHTNLPIGSSTYDSHGKAWVGIADGLPHQVISNYTISGVPGTSTTTLVYSYGVQVVITPPPVK